MKEFRYAFTLAEVLITLAIIGVVAALTIPSVIKNYQKKATITSLKKSYSTMQNAAKLAMADDNVSNFTDTHFYSFLNRPFSHTGIEPKQEIVNKYFQNARVLESGSYYKPIQGPEAHGINLSHGYRIDFPSFTYYINTDTYDGLMLVYVDTNGADKKPNVVGKDLFAFVITNPDINITEPYTVRHSGGWIMDYYHSYLHYALRGGYSKVLDPCERGGAYTCFKQIVDDQWEIKYY